MVSIKHKFHSSLPDSSNPGLIRPSNWNDEHDVSGLDIASFNTKANAEAYSPATAPDLIRIGGYYAAGDGGGALYKKAASEPSHAGKLQSADGTWWEIAEAIVNPFMFGAVGNGTTDDDAAMLALKDFKDVVAYPGVYKFSTPIVRPTYSRFLGAGENRVFLDYYGTGLAFSSDAPQEDRGFTLRSKADGQSGYRSPGGIGSKISNIQCIDFDTVSFGLGYAGASGVYFADVNHIHCENATREGGDGFIIDGGVLPNSNCNVVRNLFVKGKFDRFVVINGNANVLIGGNCEPNNSSYAPTAVVQMNGIGNKWFKPYVEPVGATVPDVMFGFGSGSRNNVIEDVYWPGNSRNASFRISDLGVGNEVQIAPNGENFTQSPPRNASFTNLMPNSGFRAVKADGMPVGWTKSGTGTISVDTTTVRGEGRSLKLESAASAVTANCFIATNIPGTRLPLKHFPIGKLRGRTMTVGAWCWSETAGLGAIKLSTGSVTYGSENHSGSGEWEFLSLQTRIEDTATEVSFQLRTDANNVATTGACYFSEPMVVVGREIPVSMPHPLDDGDAAMAGRLTWNPPITLTVDNATPSVADGNAFLEANTVATTVTNFTGAREGQEIKILTTSANTVLKNNTTIATTTGADKALSSGVIYKLIYLNSKWREF